MLWFFCLFFFNCFSFYEETKRILIFHTRRIAYITSLTYGKSIRVHDIYVYICTCMCGQMGLRCFLKV